MAEVQSPRRTEIKIIYEGADISLDIAPFLAQFDYDDKSSGEADDLQITLEDSKGLWRDPWYPSKGDKISASIVTHSWNSPGKSESLYCGLFEVDEITISEPPMTVQIKAVSAPFSTNMREEVKNKNWEDYKLSGIAQDISANAGMSLEYLASNDPRYDTRNQTGLSDMKFLLSLCEDAGLALKVTDEKIVIFDEEEFEGQPSVATIVRGESDVLNMNITSKLAGTYKGARVKYSDSQEDVTHDYLLEDEAGSDNGQTLQINERVRSEAEAEQLAKGRLRQANKGETTGSFTLMGNLSLLGGSNVNIQGYGQLDGTYFIESAKHAVGSGGYTVSLNVREGTPSKKKKKGANFPVYRGDGQ